MIYPDTSFLISCYLPEKQSEQAQRYLSILDEPLAYTPFHRLEARTSVRMRAFLKQLSAAQVREVFRDIDADLESDVLRHVPLNWNEVLREAETIADAYVIQIGARTGDVLHVACAVALDAEEFCTFDRRQLELAKRAGLKVKTW